MLDLNATFEFVNAFVLIGWILLLFFPKWKWTNRLVIGFVVLVLGVFYASIVFSALSVEDFSSFSTLDGLMTLFADKKGVLAGWIHYLAFDLLVGMLILHLSQKAKLNHFLVVPCLLFTFMIGPVGVLLFLTLRSINTKSYFIDLD
ncbi:ABA4-like family protein [Sediminitomix flava]|uniref:Uncharacterized protein DUF4281 n=1 Tax=Sediminitomix flava TaxID=379075 RepID=A0A315ZBL2_SEDFL|nr:ABA4-like family protein [Sediminitomix flava]PWJ42692.1 uncharacterized protein DUF4281 [Sediminitomix flava]